MSDDANQAELESVEASPEKQPEQQPWQPSPLASAAKNVAIAVGGICTFGFIGLMLSATSTSTYGAKTSTRVQREERQALIDEQIREIERESRHAGE